MDPGTNVYLTYQPSEHLCLSIRARARVRGAPFFLALYLVFFSVLFFSTARRGAMGGVCVCVWTGNCVWREDCGVSWRYCGWVLSASSRIARRAE
jgi:hypothetical protein